MNLKRESADASSYYHEVATADIARMDSSAMCGNLADSMRDATLLLPPTELAKTTLTDPPTEFNCGPDSNPE